MDQTKQEQKKALKDYVKEENKESFFKIMYDDLDYRATDINENIKVLINETIEPKLEEELLEDLIAQIDEIKESLTTYRKCKHLFN